MKTQRLYITLFFIAIWGTLSAQQVIKGEYFFDWDPGKGKGISITLPAAGMVDHTFGVNTGNLPAGYHFLFIRTADQSGKWSIAEGRIFFIDSSVSFSSAFLNRSEYFIDTDPGPGRGIPFASISGTSDSLEQSISISGLTPGKHNLFTRTRDNKGAWSIAEGRVFWIDTPESTPPDSVIGMEYFMGEDPGAGKGTNVLIGTKLNTDSLIEMIAPNLAFGDYNICFRIKNSQKAWSIAECRSFRVCETYGPLAGFALVQSGNKVSLLNRSEYAQSYRWNLNETDRGETENLFLETEGGNYDVFLAAQNGCGSDTSYQQFTVEGLSGIIPLSIGRTGKSTIHIQGFGFTQGTTFKLMKDGVEIPATAARVERENSLVATLYPKDMPLGFYRLEVQIPGKDLLVKDSAFEISETIQPRIIVSSRIPERVRSNVKTLFKVYVTNTGNVDAFGVPVMIGGFPINSEVRLLNDTSKPIPNLGYDLSDRASVKRFLLTDTLAGTKMIPVFIPLLAAGETFEILIEFKGKENGVTFNYYINALQPFYVNLLKEIIRSGNTPENASATLDDCGGSGNGGVGPPQPCLECVEKMAAQSATEIAKELFDKFLNESKLGELIMGKQLSCFKGIYDFTNDLYKKATDMEICPSKNGDNSKPDGLGKSVMSFADWAMGGAKLAADCYVAFNPALQVVIKAQLAYKILDSWDKIKKYKNAIDIPDDALDCLQATKPCEPPQCPDCKGGGTTAVLNSWDPNEKAGPGYTNYSFIRTNTLGKYTVSYENAPTAGLPAQTVWVTDTLDQSKINVHSLAFKTASIGKKTISLIQEGYSAIGEIDLRPEIPFIARINAFADTAKGIVQWQVQTIDTSTRQETGDPLAGFLPPNDSTHKGEGNFTFEVSLNEIVSEADTLSNKAAIVFDGNPPIITNYWINYFDNHAPSSSMIILPDTLYKDTLALNWTGSDTRSGIKYYDIYVSVNDSAYTLLIENTTETSDTIIGTFNKTYSFYSIATDKAGNSESLKTNAEAKTFLILKPTTFTFVGTGKYNDPLNWLNHAVPPEILPAGSEIIINHAANGECILNKMQKVAVGGKFTIATGKKITFVSDVEIKKSD